MKPTDHLIEQLIIAEQGEALAAKALDQSDASRQAYKKAHEKVLHLQRLVAQAENAAYCEPLDYNFLWDTGAPTPYLLRNDNKTFLCYYLKEELPGWDGTWVKIVNPVEVNGLVAVVEFKTCFTAKLGAPNDEVLHGHPLFGKGLDFYSPSIIKNSTWVKELENINKVHWGYNPLVWAKLNHYFFPFHDTTFECLAYGFTVTVFNTTMQTAVLGCCSKLF